MDAPRSQVSPRTVWTVGLHAMAVAAFGLILYQLRPLLALLAIALMLALALDPLVNLFQRAGLKRGWGVLVAVLTVLCLFFLVGVSVVPMMLDQVRNLYEAVPGFIAQVNESQWLRKLDERFDLVQTVERQLPSLPRSVAGSVVGVVSSTVGALVTGLAVLTISIFGLLSGRDLFEAVLQWVRPQRRSEVRELVVDMRRVVSGYLVGVFLTCALGAVFTGLTTFLLGVPYFLALGLLYLVFGFIPYIGSLLVAVAVSLTTLATMGFRRALIALALFMVYQQIEGNVLQPLIQKRTLQMNPLLISIVVVAGAMLMGVPGAVLALPFAAALQILLQRVQQTRTARWARQDHPSGMDSGLLMGPTVREVQREPPPVERGDAEPPLHH
jgi:predicted PurR-regulated permease PerM